MCVSNAAFCDRLIGVSHRNLALQISNKQVCFFPYDTSLTQSLADFCTNVRGGTPDPELGCILPVSDPSNRVAMRECAPPDIGAFYSGVESPAAYPACMLDFLSQAECDCSCVLIPHVQPRLTYAILFSIGTPRHQISKRAPF